eukprot:TRINITY_DN3750_c0_g1_i1.p1 TRINITY_DN3750_c0_g1~~TRINITY_DN3750_c0_g1_i1.p1  ORF type:complete len:160 (-),score=19.14 TRINITY_DN3750_c0_g1_i1:350-829(-)
MKLQHLKRLSQLTIHHNYQNPHHIRKKREPSLVMSQKPRWEIFFHLHSQFPSLTFQREDLLFLPVSAYTSLIPLVSDGPPPVYGKKCRANPEFHRKPKYDVVQIANGESPWYGKLQNLVSFEFSSVQFNQNQNPRYKNSMILIDLQTFTIQTSTCSAHR